MASFWGSPIEGLCFHVDVTNMKVLRVIDTGIYPIPTESGEIHKPEALPEPRKGLKPIQITQPEGVSFHLDRSEEHTSELQSLMRISYAAFCLKKKKHNYNRTTQRQNYIKHITIHTYTHHTR